MIKEKISKFFDTFWYSVSNKQYYKSILQLSFGFSLVYLWMLLLLLSTATVAKNTLWVVTKLPTLGRNIQLFESKVVEIYPDDLVLTIHNGELSSNVNEPYAIPLPEDWAHMLGLDDIKNLAVVDTNGKADQFKTYETVFLLTNSSLVFPDKGGFRAQPFEKYSDETIINKKKYTAYINIFQPFINNFETIVKGLLVIYVLFGPLCSSILNLIFYLIYLLLFTVPLLLVCKMSGIQFTYSQIYHLSLHGVSLPIFAVFVLSIFGVSLPFLFTFLFMCWMTMILMYLRDSGEQVPKQ